MASIQPQILSITGKGAFYPHWSIKCIQYACGHTYIAVMYVVIGPAGEVIVKREILVDETASGNLNLQSCRTVYIPQTICETALKGRFHQNLLFYMPF